MAISHPQLHPYAFESPFSSLESKKGLNDRDFDGDFAPLDLKPPISSLEGKRI
jgi:hypothetical protein